MDLFSLIPSNVRFFKDLHLPRTIKNLQYLYRGNAIVYGIRCQITNMIYIGSTLVPGRRWHNHLVTFTNSNDALQAAIAKYGLSKFTAYVFEGDVKFPASCVSHSPPPKSSGYSVYSKEKISNNIFRLWLMFGMVSRQTIGFYTFSVC